MIFFFLILNFVHEIPNARKIIKSQLSMAANFMSYWNENMRFDIGLAPFREMECYSKFENFWHQWMIYDRLFIPGRYFRRGRGSLAPLHV